MRQVLCVIVSILILGINSSSLLALSCSNYFDDSIDNEQLQNDLPVDSAIKITIGFNKDVPLTKEERYYFELKKIFITASNETEDFKFSSDPTTNTIRRLIFDRIFGKLYDAYQNSNEYAFFVNEGKSESEVASQIDEVRSSWSLDDKSSYWNDIMTSIMKIANSEVLFDSYEKLQNKVVNNFDEVMEELDQSENVTGSILDAIIGSRMSDEQRAEFLAKLMKRHDWRETLTNFTDDEKNLEGVEKYLEGVDKEIEDLINTLFWEYIAGKHYAYGDAISLSMKASDIFKKEVTRERILKETNITLKQVIWHLFEKLVLDQSLAYQEDIDDQFQEDVFQYSSNATVISSNTIITSARLLAAMGKHGQVYVKKGSEKVASIAYYIDPGFFIDAAYKIELQRSLGNDIAIVRFPEGTFDGVRQAKISTQENVTEGNLVLPRTKTKNEVIKVSNKNSSEEKDEMEEIELGFYDWQFWAVESLPDSVSAFEGSGASIFGSDNGVSAVVEYMGLGVNGLVDVSLIEDSQKFFKKITEFDSELKMNGTNIE